MIKVFVQVELGRYAITHGKTTLAAFDTLPGPRLGTSWLGWLWLFMMLTTQAQIAAMEGLVGQAAAHGLPGRIGRGGPGRRRMDPAWGTYLGGHPEYFWADPDRLAAIALLLSGGYKRLEQITTVLVATVTLMTVACVAGLPWTEYPIRLPGCRRLPVPPAGDGVALAFSTFGITGVGASELFAYPYWCIEKGYARYAGARSPDDDWARAPGAGWVMQLDAWFSMVVFTLATVAFYLLGAAVLHPQGLNPQGADMIRTLSGCTSAAGRLDPQVFLIGAWAVLFKTLYVATAANSRLTADFLDLTGLWKPIAPWAASGRSGSSASSIRSWRSPCTSASASRRGWSPSAGTPRA